MATGFGYLTRKIAIPKHFAAACFGKVSRTII